MEYILYKFIWLVGYIIREMILPNPFANFKGMDEGINLLFGFIFHPFAYFITGRIYDTSDGPIVGSVIYLVMFIILNSIFYLITLITTIVWIDILVFLIIYIILIKLSSKIRY